MRKIGSEDKEIYVKFIKNLTVTSLNCHRKACTCANTHSDHDHKRSHSLETYYGLQFRHGDEGEKNARQRI